MPRTTKQNWKRKFNNVVYKPVVLNTKWPEPDEDICSICRDKKSREVRLLYLGRDSCNHTFCSECVTKSLERNRSCPMCRAPMCIGIQYRDMKTKRINRSNECFQPKKIPYSLILRAFFDIAKLKITKMTFNLRRSSTTQPRENVQIKIKTTDDPSNENILIDDVCSLLLYFDNLPTNFKKIAQVRLEFFTFKVIMPCLALKKPHIYEHVIDFLQHNENLPSFEYSVRRELYF